MILPLELSVKAILLDQLLVVRPELVNAYSQVIVAVFGVQVKLIKELHPLKAIFIFRLQQVLVRTLVMQRVSRAQNNLLP
ncbi:MAG: hypothetical protein MZV65_38625 [Chromatiales bacterium]|nr:hypothetical protein [Chromatiales bacterium]